MPLISPQLLDTCRTWAGLVRCRSRAVRSGCPRRSSLPMVPPLGTIWTPKGGTIWTCPLKPFFPLSRSFDSVEEIVLRAARLELPRAPARITVYTQPPAGRRSGGWRRSIFGMCTLVRRHKVGLVGPPLLGSSPVAIDLLLHHLAHARTHARTHHCTHARTHARTHVHSGHRA